jgi:hypothetical protein
VVGLLKMSEFLRKIGLGKFVNPSMHSSGSYMELVGAVVWKACGFFGLSNKCEFQFAQALAAQNCKIGYRIPMSDNRDCTVRNIKMRCADTQRQVALTNIRGKVLLLDN